AAAAPAGSDRPLTLPPVGRIGHLGEARALLKEGRLLESWHATVDALRWRPFHPEAFLLLGAICQAAGDNPRAKTLLERARKMAPQAKATPVPAQPHG